MTPWAAARQASLSFTISQSLLKLNVHGVHDAIQPSHPLSCPPPPAFNLSQHQGLFQWEYAKLRGRAYGGYRWKAANQLILRWGITASYLSGPSAITKGLIHERGRQGCYCKSQKRRCDDGSKNQRRQRCVKGSDLQLRGWLRWWRKGSRATERGWTLKLEKTRKHPPPGSPERTQVCPCQHLDLRPLASRIVKQCISIV